MRFLFSRFMRGEEKVKNNQKICFRCFHEYEAGERVCPYCGYYEENTMSEARYLKEGTVLAGHYLIGIVIGAGGFGITYAAWDMTLAQRVAIKEFLPGEFSTRMPGQTTVTVYGGEKTEQFETGRGKFIDESRRLARFQGVPGIVQIYNSFEENGTAYIVMEYLEGETLDQRLKRERRIPEQEAVLILIPILQALEVVHKKGILHRDIAPNNIFLTKDGGSKLLDFGAARSATGSHSKSLTVLYKEGYTPEEQYQSRGNQGPWTDVYAVAATLYRMLTGTTPPGALERRRKDTLKAPSRIGVKVSQPVETALMNALNVDVRNRTKSAGEFVEELSGKTQVKEHFVRTIEKKVGEIPLRVKISVALIFSCMAVFLACLFTGVISFRIESFSSFLVSDGKARVPNVVNKEVDDAQNLLEARNLSIRITDKQFSGEIPKDRILSQAEDAGSIVDQGIYIEVVVSGGDKTEGNGYELADGETFVPDVQYKRVEDALRLVEEAGLETDVRYREEPSVEEGKVIEQSLKAGSVVKKGETLVFYVSGSEPEEETETAEESEPEESAAPETEPTPETTAEPTEQPVQENNGAGFQQAKAAELLTCVNQYRQAAGLSPLTWSTDCENVAMDAALQWYAGPSASIPNGYQVIGRGANGAKTAQKVVDDWMGGATYADGIIQSSNSDILNPSYTVMGGACYYDPNGDSEGYKYNWALCLK